MEVIECGPDFAGPGADGDACSVCVVEEFKYRAVDPPTRHDAEQLCNFCDWWPNAARSVISGLYGDNETRRAAAKSLMALIEEFGRRHVADVDCSYDTDAVTLQHLYRTRLMYEEQHMRRVRDVWAERIGMVVTKGGMLIRESVRAREGLRDAAKRMRTKFKSSAQAPEIVNDELRRAEKRLAKDVEAEMRVLRAEALSDVSVRQPDTHSIDQRISSLADLMIRDGREATVRALREAYRGHAQNKMNEAAQSLSSLVEREWMQALR